jgi:hypothetical protein
MASDLTKAELRAMLSDPEFSHDDVRLSGVEGVEPKKIPAYVRRSYDTQRIGRREVRTETLRLYMADEDAAGLNEDDTVIINGKPIRVVSVEPGLDGITRLILREKALSYAPEDE